MFRVQVAVHASSHGLTFFSGLELTVGSLDVDILKLNMLSVSITPDKVKAQHDKSELVDCLTKEADLLNRRSDRDDMLWEDANGRGCRWYNTQLQRYPALCKGALDADWICVFRHAVRRVSGHVLQQKVGLCASSAQCRARWCGDAMSKAR